MADPLRRQIREAVASALAGLTTSGANVFPSRTYELQDAELPGLRIYEGQLAVDESLDDGPVEDQTLAIVVEACSKRSANLDNELAEMEREVRVRVHQTAWLGGKASARFLGSDEPELDGEAEREVGVMRITFEFRFFSARGAPDVAL